MTSAVRRLATYADLTALPEGVRGQVIAGEVLLAPSPSPEHQSSLALLAADLIVAFQRGRGGPGGWWILPDVDVSFGPHDIPRPDLVGWRRERLPEFPRERPIAQRPDWVCEVLSPSTAVLTAVASVTFTGRQPCRGTGSSTPPTGPSRCLV
jgi:Uma2 family endonuclease